MADFNKKLQLDITGKGDLDKYLKNIGKEIQKIEKKQINLISKLDDKKIKGISKQLNELLKKSKIKISLEGNAETKIRTLSKILKQIKSKTITVDVKGKAEGPLKQINKLLQSISKQSKIVLDSGKEVVKQTTRTQRAVSGNNSDYKRIKKAKEEARILTKQGYNIDIDFDSEGLETIERKLNRIKKEAKEKIKIEISDSGGLQKLNNELNRARRKDQSLAGVAGYQYNLGELYADTAKAALLGSGAYYLGQEFGQDKVLKQQGILLGQSGQEVESNISIREAIKNKTGTAEFTLPTYLVSELQKIQNFRPELSDEQLGDLGAKILLAAKTSGGQLDAREITGGLLKAAQNFENDSVGEILDYMSATQLKVDGRYADLADTFGEYSSAVGKGLKLNAKDFSNLLISLDKEGVRNTDQIGAMLQEFTITMNTESQKLKDIGYSQEEIVKLQEKFQTGDAGTQREIFGEVVSKINDLDPVFKEFGVNGSQIVDLIKQSREEGTSLSKVFDENGIRTDIIQSLDLTNSDTQDKFLTKFEAFAGFFKSMGEDTGNIKILDAIEKWIKNEEDYLKDIGSLDDILKDQNLALSSLGQKFGTELKNQLEWGKQLVSPLVGFLNESPKLISGITTLALIGGAGGVLWKSLAVLIQLKRDISNYRVFLNESLKENKYTNILLNKIAGLQTKQVTQQQLSSVNGLPGISGQGNNKTGGTLDKLNSGLLRLAGAVSTAAIAYSVLNPLVMAATEQYSQDITTKRDNEDLIRQYFNRYLIDTTNKELSNGTQEEKLKYAENLRSNILSEYGGLKRVTSQKQFVENELMPYVDSLISSNAGKHSINIEETRKKLEEERKKVGEDNYSKREVNIKIDGFKIDVTGNVNVNKEQLDEIVSKTGERIAQDVAREVKNSSNGIGTVGKYN